MVAAVGGALGFCNRRKYLFALLECGMSITTWHVELLPSAVAFLALALALASRSVSIAASVVVVDGVQNPEAKTKCTHIVFG